MKTRFILLMSIIACLFLSLAATLVSYFYFTGPLSVDGRILYRGWPLQWATESWSYWTLPPLHYVSFQPFNFFIDLVFYSIMLQVPLQAYIYSKEVRKKQTLTSKN